jgi:hypothetical protein
MDRLEVFRSGRQCTEVNIFHTRALARVGARNQMRVSAKNDVLSRATW